MQENDDSVEEGVVAHPDFMLNDPSQIIFDFPDDENVTSPYLKIDLLPEVDIRNLTLNLDSDQRRVFDIMIDYTIKLKRWKEKLDKFKGPPPLPPHMVLQGQAGAGKTTLIEALSQRIEKLMRSSGDAPDHPYILKMAFTGTAASHIGGQTIHSAFSLKFGGAYVSLTREKVKKVSPSMDQLTFCIIDEFSLDSPDLLYHIHCRLNEIKCIASRDFIPFGGVCHLNR